jgi:hypothetical protein
VRDIGMTARALLALALVLPCAACGGSPASDLDAETVSRIPPGDAVGTATSGRYAVEVYTSACAGSCPAVVYDLVTFTSCDVGYRFNQTAQVDQTDGRLQVDTTGGQTIITRFVGGLGTDGRFDVGGVGTELGGQIAASARLDGSFTEGRLAATARARIDGTVEGQAIACTATYDVTGTRR